MIASAPITISEEMRTGVIKILSDMITITAAAAAAALIVIAILMVMGIVGRREEAEAAVLSDLRWVFGTSQQKVFFSMPLFSGNQIP